MHPLTLDLADTQHVDPPAHPAHFPAPAGLDHRHLRDDDFWRAIPAFAHISPAQFHSHTFQARHSVTTIPQLRETLRHLPLPDSFFHDIALGLQRAPMALRISPYLLSLIDWSAPDTDPIRTQFIPLASRQVPDHPCLHLDSLREQADSPVPGLTHRYRDKALFLPLTSCPVYCRFCTRSYAIGTDTQAVDKLKFPGGISRWQAVFDYIAAHPELEDIVISGGDTYNLRADHIRLIGERLLAMPHIRRIRYATKGLAVMPQKILTDSPWLQALASVATLARRLHKDLALHTHFNHPSEITAVTRRATDLLTEHGIFIRCQTVLQNGVNSDPAVMQLLVRRLAYVNIHPYYVYFHDMVPGVEDLRTSLHTGLLLEKHVRGHTAGFNTPSFVVDTMGGGGKRDAHSFEYYDRTHGLALFTSPAVKPGATFFYFDPLSTLSPSARSVWLHPASRASLLSDTLSRLPAT